MPIAQETDVRVLLVVIAALLVTIPATAGVEELQARLTAEDLLRGGQKITLDASLIARLLEKESLSSAEVAILGASGSPRARARLISLAQKGAEPVRANALFGLGLLRDPQALPVLEEAAKDPLPVVREAALQALSILDERSGHSSFLASLSDRSPGVRRAAIAGIALSSSADLWRQALSSELPADSRKELREHLRYAPREIVDEQIEGWAQDELLGYDLLVAAATKPNPRIVREIESAVMKNPALEEAPCRALLQLGEAVLEKMASRLLATSARSCLSIAMAFRGKESYYERALDEIDRQTYARSAVFDGPLLNPPGDVSPAFVEWLSNTASTSSERQLKSVLALSIISPEHLPANAAETFSGRQKNRLVFAADRFGRARAISPNVPAVLSMRCTSFVPPVPARTAATHYPASRKRSGVEAAVTLEIRTDKQGAVRDVYLLGPAPDPEFAGAAFYSVRFWRFLPAVCASEKTEGTYRLTLLFRLKNLRENKGMKELQQSLPNRR